MNSYTVVLTCFGVIVLLTAWLPMVFKELPLSLPIFCVALGAAIFALPGVPGLPPQPRTALLATERLTEIVVLVALTGAGLKLDRQLDWFTAKPTWRLLAISMPLTIIAITLLAHLLLGLGWATSLLLGAVLAPTDPVLASDVQVGPPQKGGEDTVRFTLTSEASLNDSLAFPFVSLAVVMAATSSAGHEWIWHWALVDVLWSLAAGLAIGWLVGRGMAYLTFRLPNRARLSRTGDGFVSLGMTFIAFGLTQMVGGSGFTAVFVAALAFRSVERGHSYHEKLHDFSEQSERLLMMIVLVLFGGALTGGGLLAAMTWPAVVLALLAVFVVRPLSGWIGLAGVPIAREEKAIVSFFGIRGIGTMYYIAFALGRARFEAPDLLWSTVALIILISIVLHGVSVTPVMRRLDHRREQRVAQDTHEKQQQVEADADYS
jgi:NhaP-type Na+/H+ or K+/H+ antiporter